LPSRRPRKAAKRAKKPKKRIGALFADSEDEDE
jgi:hypothetical protein